MVDFVYFAQRRSDGAIKIGCAYNVALRLKAIGRRGDRLDLLASTEGGRALEGRFHAFLLDHHVGHEWFAPASEVMRVIGGWNVLLPVMGAVIGQPIHDFFREQMRQAAREAARAQHHEKLAEAAWTRLESRSAALGEDRPSRKAAGTLGSEEAGSVERLSGEGR